MKTLNVLILCFFVSNIAFGIGVNEERPISKNSLSSVDKDKFEKYCANDWDLKESDDNYTTGFITVGKGESQDAAFAKAGKACEKFKPNGRIFASGSSSIQNNYSEIKSRKETVDLTGNKKAHYYVSEGICCTPFVTE